MKSAYSESQSTVPGDNFSHELDKFVVLLDLQLREMQRAEDVKAQDAMPQPQPEQPPAQPSGTLVLARAARAYALFPCLNRHFVPGGAAHRARGMASSVTSDAQRQGRTTRPLRANCSPQRHSSWRPSGRPTWVWIEET